MQDMQVTISLNDLATLMQDMTALEERAARAERERDTAEKNATTWRENYAEEHRAKAQVLFAFGTERSILERNLADATEVARRASAQADKFRKLAEEYKQQLAFALGKDAAALARRFQEGA